MQVATSHEEHIGGLASTPNDDTSKHQMGNTKDALLHDYSQTPHELDYDDILNPNASVHAPQYDDLSSQTSIQPKPLKRPSSYKKLSEEQKKGNNLNFNQGRWTRLEHFRFLSALKAFGKDWQ